MLLLIALDNAASIIIVVEIEQGFFLIENRNLVVTNQIERFVTSMSLLSVINSGSTIE